jgi:hypothetical protein
VALRLHEILASGLLLALPAAMVALDCTTAAAPVPGCSDLCLSQLSCWNTLADCTKACTALQAACNQSGHPSAFEAYATCATDAGFTCVDGGADGGAATVNAACVGQQNTLEQCRVEVDGGFEIPDGALAADLACVGTSGCVACCQKHHPEGGSAFLEAVFACECGDAGACVVEAGSCQTECAAHLQGDGGAPATGDPCDQCLTSTLNDQAIEAGACVTPVTIACNKSVDCALYVNCATQVGCTN